MTLETFSRDVVPILQLILMSVGLVSLILLWRQNKQINLWNKLNSSLNFINVPLLSKLQLDYFESLTKLKIDPHKTALSEEEAMLIHSDNSAFIATIAYLKNIENICAAVEIGSVDDDCAYAVHANGVLRSYYKFKTFIDYLRKKLSDDEIYIEIEKVACKWGEMDSCTIKKRKKMKKPEPSKKGAQKKV